MSVGSLQCVLCPGSIKTQWESLPRARQVGGEGCRKEGYGMHWLHFHTVVGWIMEMRGE